MKYDAIIVGGGASGLAAGVFLGRAGVRALILERGPRVGRKLLATGNGTCNLSNLAASPAFYHGADPAFTDSALAAFGPREAMDFFHSIGIYCVAREDGRVYPLCEQAGAVLDCLRAELTRHGVETVCDCEVIGIKPVADGFEILYCGGNYTAKTVIIAAGGEASPSLGGVTGGYRLLESLGHTVSPRFPAIVQIKTDTAFIKAMQGIRVDGTLSLCRDGKPVASAEDEILFTEYGLSGPAALAVSRYAGKGLSAHINFLSGWNREQLIDELKMRKRPKRSLEDYLTGLLNKRVGQTVIRAAGFSLSAPSAGLTKAEINAIADGIQNFTVQVEGTRGMESAQVTAGGALTGGFDPASMESRLVPGLYATGEVLDIDGDCGGFNLQWAWSSAYAAAAKGIVNKVK